MLSQREVKGLVNNLGILKDSQYLKYYSENEGASRGLPSVTTLTVLIVSYSPDPTTNYKTKNPE